MVTETTWVAVPSDSPRITCPTVTLDYNNNKKKKHVSLTLFYSDNLNLLNISPEIMSAQQ
jgi:hypothetical protein